MTRQNLPNKVALSIDDGMTQASVANLDHILSVRQSDLRKYVGHLDDARMREVCRAAAIALGRA